MKNQDIISSLSSLPLFHGIDSPLWQTSIENGAAVVLSFPAGAEIFSPANKEKKLGVILSGLACVFSASENSGALLRTLEAGDTFGVANLFCNREEYVSLILAKKPCRVLFFSHDLIEELIQNDSAFRMNYIRFLSERICFLNAKIACFTAGSPEQKLASFLLSGSQDESEQYSLSINANSLSEMLNIGRASLYRAFEKMEAEGLITKEGKQITVPNKNILKQRLADL